MNGIDKRTKVYKEWVKNHEKESSGLGDTVEKITKATGIKKVVEKFTPEGYDCGCDDRKNKLNELFPYAKPLCFNEQEFNYLADFFDTNVTTVTPTVQKEVLAIYNRIFTDKKQATNCGQCFFNGVVDKLQKVYNQYL